jgi:hypothetical protein
VDVLFVVDDCVVEADVLRILGLTSYFFNPVGVIVVYRNVAPHPRQLRGFQSAAVGVVSRMVFVECDGAVLGVRWSCGPDFASCVFVSYALQKTLY